MVGGNGAGKTTLVKAMADLLPVVRGNLSWHGMDLPASISYVAGDARRNLWRKEQELAHARDFSGEAFAVTRLRDLLLEQVSCSEPGDGETFQHGITVSANNRSCHPPQQLAETTRCWGLESLLDRPVSALSAGEMSRVQIACALLREPKLLILDEPFDGLDPKSRKDLILLVDRLTQTGISLILVTHRREELPSAITHLLVLEQEAIQWQGPISRSPLRPGSHSGTTTFTPSPFCRPPALPAPSPAMVPLPLIEMTSVTVRYGDTLVLDHLTWSVREGQHWIITGPNGAGKSTLLSLVTGECPQVYANPIRLFGRHRGPLLSLEDIRKYIGMVNTGLVAGYQKPVTVLDVVCSGFFDSVGLYRRPDAKEMETARNWLSRLKLSSLEEKMFNRLSQGQRQMVLITRAMVKSPRLLILDEPMAGLDAANRRRVATLLDDLAREKRTTLLLVSHHRGEFPACITHHLVLDQGRVMYKGPHGGYPGLDRMICG